MLGNVWNTKHIMVSQHPLACDLSQHSSDPRLALGLYRIVLAQLRVM